MSKYHPMLLKLSHGEAIQISMSSIRDKERIRMGLIQLKQRLNISDDFIISARFLGRNREGLLVYEFSLTKKVKLPDIFDPLVNPSEAFLKEMEDIAKESLEKNA